MRSDFVGANDYGCDEHNTVSDSSPTNMYIMGLPNVLVELYADSASSLSFVVLLREPIARMQSDYYFCKGCTPYDTTDFAAYVAALEYHMPQNYSIIRGNGIPLGADVNIAARSFYALQMEPWLSPLLQPDSISYVPLTSGGVAPFFRASQFSVLPSGWATLHAQEAVAGLFKQFPGVTLDASKVSKEPTHLMRNNPHPPLDEDLDQATITRLRSRFFGPDTEYLSFLLSEAMAKGLTVGGFDPSGGVTPAKIQEHLEAWWDL
jgi:hypothetical protein